MPKSEKKVGKSTSKRAVKKTSGDEFQFENFGTNDDIYLYTDSQENSDIKLEVTNNQDVQFRDMSDALELIGVKNDRIGFDVGGSKYIEIHKGNIFHYFASGLISPSKYIENRAFPDLQSINKNTLIVTNSHSGSDSEDIVFLEIEFIEADKNSIIVHSNFACLFQPLPITRIKTVYVRNEEIKKSVISDALLFNGGYIPEEIIKVKSILKEQHFDFENDEFKHPAIDYTYQIRKFDKILGLLAFLRNYNLLITAKTNSYKTLPNHFFYALQAIDNAFGCELVPNNIISEFYSYLINDNCPPEKELLKWLFLRVNELDNFNDIDTQEFAKLYFNGSNDPETDKDVKQIFGALSKNIERKSALEKTDKIKSKSALPLYLFAFLRNYANLNSVEIVRKDISLVYSQTFGEYGFALLGYFFGYKNLRNTDDRLDLSSPIFKILKAIPIKPPIKFQLTTLFDYQIIELVFRHIFYSQNLAKLSDLSTRHLKIETFIKEKSINPNYIVSEGLVYGKLYQTVTPNDPLSEVNSHLNRLPNEIPFLSEFGWYCYRLGLKMKPFTISDFFTTPVSIIKQMGYAKDDLIQFIDENRNKIDVEELKTRISLSLKQKEM